MQELFLYSMQLTFMQKKQALCDLMSNIKIGVIHWKRHELNNDDSKKGDSLGTNHV